MAASPTVSVVIPCYNGARFLRETLASVSAQTHPALEVLVVDDGSTDESAAVAGAFGPPVRVIRQPNQGESVARNRGVDEATGDWVAFLDADDLWEPAKLAKQLAAVARTGDRGCCTATYKFAEAGGEREPPDVPDPAAFNVPDILRLKSNCQISSLIVHRSVPARFPEWTRSTEDLFYLIDVLAHTPVTVVPEPLSGYRRHGRNQTAARDVFLNWHASQAEWLRRNADRLPPADRAEYQVASLELLAEGCRRYFRSRDWDLYRRCKAILDAHPGPASPAMAVPAQRYPGWVYRLSDAADRSAPRWVRWARQAVVGPLVRGGRRALFGRPAGG